MKECREFGLQTQWGPGFIPCAGVEQLIEQGKHHAEETGETFDPASVKGPKVTVLLKGEGAVIR